MNKCKLGTQKHCYFDFDESVESRLFASLHYGDIATTPNGALGRTL